MGFGIGKLEADAQNRKAYCNKEQRLKTVYSTIVSKMAEAVENNDEAFDDPMIMAEILEKVMILKEKYQDVSSEGFEGDKNEKFFVRNTAPPAVGGKKKKKKKKNA